MEIEERNEGDVAVLEVRGSLMIGSEVQAFHAHVKDMTERGEVKVVVDFGHVDYCGSVMLGQLTASKSSLGEKGGDIRFANVAAKLDALLRITGLRGVFEQFGSVDEAVKSYAGA